MKNSRKLKIAGIVFLLTLIVPATFSGLLTTKAGASNSGLISYWKLDEGSGTNIGDSSGANNGTMYNAFWTKGKIGGALGFGGGARVTIPDSASLNPYEITVETWVKLNRIAHHANPYSSTSSDAQDLVCKGSGMGTGGYFLQQGGDDASTTTFYFQIAPFSSLQYANATSMILETNRWYYVVGTYDGNTLRIYVDGVLKGIKEIGTVQLENTMPLYLGYESAPFPYYLNGVLDEVAIYNRALSDLEIQQNYAGGNPSPSTSSPYVSSSPNTNSPSSSPSSSPLTPTPPPTNPPTTTQQESILPQIAAITIAAIISVFAILTFIRHKQNKKIETTNQQKIIQPKAGAPLIKSTDHIFISHIEEDADVAMEIAKALEKAGYKTWYYERDSLSGPSYLLQTKQAVEQSQAVILIISSQSLGSSQITKEVVRAHESGKHFIPVLRDISHAEFQRRQPEWQEALGSATSISIPKQGVTNILPRITGGLAALGVKKENEFPESHF